MSNFAFIGGIVKEAPYFVDSFLAIELNIYRADLNKEESLTVMTDNKETISRALSLIQKDSYFLTTNAHLRTKAYVRTKDLQCSECYNIESIKVNSERTEIIFDDFCVMQTDNTKAFGINKVFLEGNICNQLNYREKDGRAYCKYKLAVNENIYDSHAEYPFVVTFGKDAELSQKYLERNSRVFVEGSIQERGIKQTTHFICPECGTEADKKTSNIVREVITSKVLFLDKDRNKQDEDI